MGIYIVAIWSAVLGLLNLIRLLLTFSIDSPELLKDMSLPQFYLYQWACLIFGLGFLGATVGLWRRRNWARVLFLGIALVFFVTAMAGLFVSAPADPSVASRLIRGGRYLLSIILPFIYLNLPFVKDKFKPA